MVIAKNTITMSLLEYIYVKYALITKRILKSQCSYAHKIEHYSHDTSRFFARELEETMVVAYPYFIFPLFFYDAVNDEKYHSNMIIFVI